MLGANLSGTHDISGYNSYAAVPDFHRRIAPMRVTPTPDKD
jgi:hypothetical protein